MFLLTVIFRVVKEHFLPYQNFVLYGSAFTSQHCALFPYVF